MGGEGLARGYLNRADLTAERFIPNPFSAEPGQRLYKSGDVCRYFHNGEIEYLGRADQQVKIRGYRIELGEIEAALSQHPMIRANAVMLCDEQSRQKRLVAYVVPNRESPPSVGELNQFLRERIPEYMLPATFVMLNAQPRTPSGKTDRPLYLLLIESDLIWKHRSRHLVRRLKKPWRQSGRTCWNGFDGVYDNFFELGGHSLLGTQVVSRLREAFQLDLPSANCLITRLWPG